MSRRPQPFSTVGGKKSDLTVHSAERSATARALAHLFAHEPQPRIFARIDGTPVFVVRVPNAAAELRVLSRDHLINFSHDVVQPIKRTNQGRIEISLPDRVADLTLATLTSERLLPIIVGTTTGPILRPNGDVCCTPGFDAATGLFICDAPTLALPERPTKEDAKHALRQLRAPFATFAYADGIFKMEQREVGDKQVATSVVDLNKNPGNDESGFLHALLTAACRSALWLAPAFAYRSPAISGSGVGKGLLAKAPSVIAFGELPQIVSLGSGDELGKGLTAALMRGGHSILIDNLNNQTLRSNTLCSALSERPAFLRALGLSRLIPVNSTALISLTGCALNIGRDLVRRTVVIDLDAKIEDPEQREFKAGFLDDLRARRVELLQHVFTILRWGRQNSSTLKHGKALGGYDQWCNWVRDPLFTFDCPDPVARLTQLKITDPDRINIFDIFETWWEHHKDDWVAASKLHDAVQQLLLHARKFSRQRINYEVRELVGTRIANFLLQERSKASKWSAAEFRLIKTDSPRAREGFYDQQGEAPVTPEAAAPAAATSDPAESNDADGWQFNREPESEEDAAAPASKETAAPAAPPDAFNAEGRLAVWRNASAPLNSETEPCPGWRPGEWPRVHACIEQFLAGPRALAAARAGWGALDLFAVHKVVGVAARDCVGALAGNTTNGFAVRVEADGTLQFANGTKARKRPLDSNLCTPIWAFRKPKEAIEGGSQ